MLSEKNDRKWKMWKKSDKTNREVPQKPAGHYYPNHITFLHCI